MAKPSARPALSADAEEFLSALAVELGRSRNTVISYRRDLISYEAFLATRGRTIKDARLDDVEEHLAAGRAAGLSPASVARGVAAVRGLHRFGLEEGWATSDPTAELAPVRSPKRLPKALSEPEVERLLAAATGDEPVDRRDGAILEVL